MGLNLGFAKLYSLFWLKQNRKSLSDPDKAQIAQYKVVV